MLYRNTRNKLAIDSISASGMKKEIIYTTLSMAKKATTTRCGPIRFWQFRSITQFSIRKIGQACLEAVKTNLLTPLGLRSLAPNEKDYKPRYDGDLRSRDAAYHQGTVWPWLLGPFIDAWLKVHLNDTQSVAGFLAAFEGHLQDGALGSIGEIFDAEPPYRQRGCVAQAWSVAEILRSYIKQKDAEK